MPEKFIFDSGDSSQSEGGEGEGGDEMRPLEESSLITAVGGGLGGGAGGGSSMKLQGHSSLEPR